MKTTHLLNVINRSVCAMSILLATSHPAASAPLPVPERGFISSQPAKIWEEGLICGNGTIGADALSRPTNEGIIFTHERLFLPMGVRMEVNVFVEERGARVTGEMQTEFVRLC